MSDVLFNVLFGVAALGGLGWWVWTHKAKLQAQVEQLQARIHPSATAANPATPPSTPAPSVDPTAHATAILAGVTAAIEAAKPAPVVTEHDRWLALDPTLRAYVPEPGSDVAAIFAERAARWVNTPAPAPVSWPTSVSGVGQRFVVDVVPNVVYSTMFPAGGSVSVVVTEGQGTMIMLWKGSDPTVPVSGAVDAAFVRAEAGEVVYFQTTKACRINLDV